jgi:hypothetical protein
MSFAGQVLCQRMVIAPCALTMLGAATAAAAPRPAVVKNLRREASPPERGSELFMVTSLACGTVRPLPAQHRKGTVESKPLI